MKRIARLVAAIALMTGCRTEAQPVRASTPDALPAFFQNGDVRLAFTLDLPPGQGPFPAVVLGHGSGRLTRDDLRWFASQWTRLGFAVLRFDKRRVGESTGSFVFV